MASREESHESRLAHLLAMALDIEPMLFEEVVQVASKDELTGAYKATFFQSYLDNELKRAHVLRYPLGVLRVEIQSDPPSDSAHRTMVQDLLLRSVAEAVTDGLRVTDWIARSGEDELSIVLPGCPLNRVIHLAEEVLARIGPITEFDHAGKEIRPIAILAGAVFVRGYPSLDNLFSAVGAATSSARERGPGKVVIRTVDPWGQSQSAA